MPRIHLLAVAALVASAAAVTDRTCYYPDGSISPQDMPCSDSDVSHCCNGMNACLSTGYCMSAEQQPYVISRGSCTDSSWGSGCPVRCAGSSDNPGGGRPISWLGTKNSAGSYLYCCGALTVDSDGDLACDNDESSFTLGSATIMFDAAILANTTDVSEETSSSSAEPSSAVCSSAADPSSSDFGGDSGDDSSSKTTAVGAGVGVSLGAVAAAALSWALWERRKRTKMLQDFRNGRLPENMAMNMHMGDGSATEGTAGLGGYGKVYGSPQPAELSAYPRQELPAQ